MGLNSMSKLTTKINIRVEVWPKIYSKFMSTEEQELSDAENIIAQIKRHVDDIAYCDIVWDTEILCEYCNYTWDETEACCDKAQAEFLKEKDSI